MKLGASILVLGAVLATEPARAADVPTLSPEQIDRLDQRGFFSPEFKSAVHEMFDAQQALVEARAEEASLKAALPALQQKALEAQAKVAGQRQELAKYDRPEESDFVALQNLMKDGNARTQDQLALAQAYVWTYPTDPHQTEAQQDVQQLQKKIADAVQADKDRAAANTARRANLLQRARAHDLSLAEWRDFLQDKSQTEVVDAIGQPSFNGSSYWTYSGAWTSDPDTQKKVGIQIAFNGGRVLTVAMAPP